MRRSARVLPIMSLEIQSYELPPIGTQCYVVANDATQELAVFDAPLNGWATVEALAVRTGYRIAGLWFTHGHWDHTLDGKRFEEAGIPIYGHIGDRLFYETPEIMASHSMPGLKMLPVNVGTWLEHGQVIEIVGRPVEVRHVPGHSPGSILYWFKEDGFAIVGDAIFQGSIGRTVFPNCSFNDLEAAI